ncbi:MAG: hydroxyacid dehydrogenase [Candidatus Bipolaricaulia bacterium]
MKVVLYEVEPWEQTTFESLQSEHELAFVEAPLRSDTLGDQTDADVVSTFIYSRLGADVLAQFPNLKLITTRSTGYDHVDLDYCREHGITVCNVPTYGDHTVAEHVFGLLLTISHNLVEAIDRTRKGDFSMRGLRGFDLLGKTLGVVGTGAIGQQVVRIARGFDMDVLAYDVAPNDELARELGFQYADFDDVLTTSDVVTLHVPATPQTRHLISSEEFARMKPGAVLINTARGNVVDTTALLEALAEGRIAAAGLDVLSEEPAIHEEAELLRKEFRRQHDMEALLADHVLLRQRNVFITPHSAFNTREAVLRILETTRDNIAAFAQRSPQNTV